MGNRSKFILIIAAVLLVLVIIAQQIYFRTVGFSNSGGSSIQTEINEKINTIKSDSLKKGKVIRFLADLEIRLTSLYDNINKNNNELVKNYTLTNTDVQFDRKNETDPYSFYSKLRTAVAKSTRSVENINRDYGILEARTTAVTARRSVSYTEEKLTPVEIRSDFYTTKLYNEYREAFQLSTLSSLSFTEGMITEKQVKDEIKSFDQEYFARAITNWLRAIKKVQGEAKNEKENLITEQSETQSTIERMQVELGQINSLGRDKVLMTVAVPLFSVLIILLFAIPYLYSNVTVTDANNNSTSILVEIFSKGLLLKIFTVFLLTISIVLLATGDKIKGETIGTLLGGISVYILQNSFGKNDKEDDRTGIPLHTPNQGNGGNAGGGSNDGNGAAGQI